MNEKVLTSNLVAKLRAEVVVPYKDGYEPMRAPPSKLMTDAADEIERLTADFQQVHHNCIHARSVADKALELLSSVRLDQMASEWNCALVEVRALARSVPPVETPARLICENCKQQWSPQPHQCPTCGFPVKTPTDAPL